MIPHLYHQTIGGLNGTQRVTDHHQIINEDMNILRYEENRQIYNATTRHIENTTKWQSEKKNRTKYRHKRKKLWKI